MNQINTNKFKWYLPSGWMRNTESRRRKGLVDDCGDDDTMIVKV